MPFLRTSRATILAVFFLQAVGSGGLFPRIADIQHGLGLGERGLGLVLMAPAMGALASFLFAAAILARFGTRLVLAGGIIANAAAAVALAVSANAALAFAAFLVIGAGFSLGNVAMNVEADRVEAATGARIMSRCHGLWGIGQLAAALLGTAASAIPVTPLTQFLVMLPVVILGVLLIVTPMVPAPPRERKPASGPGARLVRPTLATLMLVGFGSLASLTEGTVRNWSVVFMRSEFTLPDWLDTLALPAFLVMLSAGRMFGDGWADRLGPRRLARRLITVALAGLCLVVLAPGLPVALAGFAMMGIGICVVYPLTISAAAQIGDRPAAENVAAFTLVNALAMLAAPPLIGLVAEQTGIRIAFALLIPLFVISLALARRVLQPR